MLNAGCGNLERIQQEEGVSPTSRQRIFLVLLAVLLLAAAALRIPRLDRTPWMDEVYTLEWAEKTYGDAIRDEVTALVPNLAPLTPLVSKAFVDGLASPVLAEELAARIPHFLFGLAGIGVFMAVFRRRIGLMGALAGALFLTTLPLHIKYSAEMRFYAFVFLSEICLLAALLALLERWSARRLAWVFLVAFLGVFNHLSFIAALAAALAAVAVVLFFGRGEARLSGRIGRVVLVGVCCAAAVGTAFLPSTLLSGGTKKIASVFEMLSEEGTRTGVANAPAEKSEGYALTWGQWRGFVENHYLAAKGPASVSFYLAVAAAGAAFLLLCHRRMLALALFPLAIHLPFLFLRVGHFWTERYLIIQCVSLTLLFAAGVQGVFALSRRLLPGRMGHVGGCCAAGGILVVMCLLRVSPVQGILRGGDTDDLRPRAELLADRIQYGDVLAMERGKWGFRPHNTLKRFLERDPRTAAGIAPTLRWYAPENTGELAKSAGFCRDNNIWIVTRPTGQLSEGDRKGLEEAGAEPLLLRNGVGLWVMGRDTVNMLEDGGFERPESGNGLPAGWTLRNAEGERFGGKTLSASVTGGAPFRPFWLKAARGPAGETEGIAAAAGEEYVVSFEARCADADQPRAPRGMVVLAFGNRDLANVVSTVRLTPEWRLYAFPVVPGRHTEGAVSDPMVGLSLQTSDGSCEIFLDNVQLERGRSATPFTRDTRNLGAAAKAHAR
ncbi:MAG TPA: hypothetical protein PKN23_12540 [Candidatus Hydrogenedentes bacterium]|nr:hypothetical protein [Candidatus Hydrogenedentota bacterium]